MTIGPGCHGHGVVSLKQLGVDSGWMFTPNMASLCLDVSCLSQTNLNSSCRKITPMGPMGPDIWMPHLAADPARQPKISRLSTTLLTSPQSTVLHGPMIENMFTGLQLPTNELRVSGIRLGLHTSAMASIGDQVAVATIFRRQISVEAPGKVRKVPPHGPVPVPLAFSRLKPATAHHQCRMKTGGLGFEIKKIQRHHEYS